MARTIGKVKIRKLKAIIREEIANEKLKLFSDFNWKNVDEKVIDRLPLEWWDIWESGHDEIHRILNDCTSEYAHTGEIK
jgi:hypothetical protein